MFVVSVMQFVWVVWFIFFPVSCHLYIWLLCDALVFTRFSSSRKLFYYFRCWFQSVKRLPIYILLCCHFIFLLNIFTILILIFITLCLYSTTFKLKLYFGMIAILSQVNKRKCNYHHFPSILIFTTSLRSPLRTCKYLPIHIELNSKFIIHFNESVVLPCIV